MFSEKEKIYAKLNGITISTEDVLWESEVAGNKLITICMFVCAGILTVAGVVNQLGLFEVPASIMIVACQFGIPVLLIPAIISVCVKYEKKWLKFFLMIMFIIVITSVDAILTYNVELIIMLPVLFSIRYYNGSYTLLTAGFTVITFLISTVFFFELGLIDLNFIGPAIDSSKHFEFYDHLAGDIFQKDDYIDPAVYGSNFLKLHFLPKIMIFALISVISSYIAHRGKEMVLREREIKDNSTRIETELNLATDIQANLLPSIFPPFPERKEIDVFASMHPAKEVGGDFYDFFLVDEDHLALVVADVSGKGIPAALFMVTAKTLIKDHASLGFEPGKVFTVVNNMLCEGNDAGLFVTGWMAVINLKTGRVVTVNAGHNPPLVCRGRKTMDGMPGANCEFEYLRTKSGFVLAGMEDIKYRAYSFNMYPGDMLYLYTDGVTEATNSEDELYGEERLQECLNSRKWESMNELAEEVKVSVDRFANKAPQFDDITMLAFRYLGPDGDPSKDVESITVRTTTENVEYVEEFVEGVMSKYNVPARAAYQINIAIDELYSNIVKFAYIDEKTGEPSEGDATIKARPVMDGDVVKGITLSFIDGGIPYNPLSRGEVQTDQSAEDRPIGGLGLHIVKKQMDDIRYEYIDEKNVLTITKLF